MVRRSGSRASTGSLGQSVDWLAGRPAGRLAAWLPGCLAAWLPGCWLVAARAPRAQEWAPSHGAPKCKTPPMKACTENRVFAKTPGCLICLHAYTRTSERACTQTQKHIYIYIYIYIYTHIYIYTYR